MAEFWERAAEQDALFHVDDRGRVGEDFWRGGEEVVETFERELGFSIAGDRLVEIGCGVGRVTRVLAQRAAAVTAIDISTRMLALAREHNPELRDVEWLHGDGATLAGVPDASTDGVFSHVVFQHIPDPAITLGYVTEMGRVLRPDGWAAFQVSDDPKVHRRRLRGIRHPAWRGSAVDLGALRETAEAVGLVVEAIAGPGTQFCLVRLSR
jgi:ubiquinone/menaquinone biosynthesis C-methylase UbiE